MAYSGRMVSIQICCCQQCRIVHYHKKRQCV